MKDQIVIRILPHSGELTSASIVEWGLLDEQCQITSSGSGSIADLGVEFRDVITQYAVNVIIPGQNVLLCRATTPTKKISQLKRALPFMVEELLADDIENVHLALSEPIDISAGTIDVMVISHRLLINYLDIFHTNSLSPDLVTPDILAIPIIGNSWSIVIDGGESIIRTGIMSGVVSSNDDLEMIFESLLAEEGLVKNNTEESEGNNSLVFNVIASKNDEKSAQLAANIASYLRDNYAFLDVKEDLYQETVSELIFSTHVANIVDERKAKPVNILQGGYRVREEQQNSWHHWYKVASVAAVGLFVYLIFSLANGWYFSSEADKLEQQSIALYKQLFPNERRIVSPKKQFQNHLRQVDSSQASSSFLTLLTQLSDSVFLNNQLNSQRQGLSVADISINKLRYDQGADSLQLEVQSKSIDQLDQLKNKLSDVGLTATVNSATEQGDSMLSRLVVERL